MGLEAGQKDRLLAGFALASNLLQLAGVYWDVGTHHAFVRESFWSPPHLAIYAGVALALAAAAAGLRGGRIGVGGPPTPIRFGRYGLAILGPAIQVLAAPIDELWHRVIGQDVSIWSPPHLLGILGGMIGVLGWLFVLVGAAGPSATNRTGRALTFGFSVLLLTGALFALGEYDHDQVVREPWLYPILASVLAPWILVAARGWLGWAWAGTALAVCYTILRSALALGVWGIGLPWMGVPPLVVLAALSLDLAMARGAPGAAGMAFALVFTVSDYPLTYLLSGRAWSVLAWAGTLPAAAIAGWASARFGRWLSRSALESHPGVKPRVDLREREPSR